MGKVVTAIGQSRESEKSHSWPVSVEGDVRLDMPPELTSPAGGLGGPAPPVKEWVTRRGSPNPPGSGTTTRSAAEEEEAMWGGSQYVVGRAQHCGRYACVQLPESVFGCTRHRVNSEIIGFFRLFKFYLDKKSSAAVQTP